MMTIPATTPLDHRLLSQFARQRPELAGVAERMLVLLDSARPFERSQFEPGHFTASAFVLSPDRQHLLLIFHNKLRRWLQPGGHVEPSDLSLDQAARREVVEETGVRDLTPLGDGIFDLDIHDIPARPTEAQHQHFDVRFAYLAGSDALQASAEVDGARWVPLEEVAALNAEESILRPANQIHRHHSARGLSRLVHDGAHSRAASEGSGSEH